MESNSSEMASMYASNNIGIDSSSYDTNHNSTSGGNMSFVNSNDTVGVSSNGGQSSFFNGSGSSLEQATMTHRMTALTSKIKEFKNNKLENTRNWSQFIGQRNQYTVPTIDSTSTRIKENVVYFQTNYMILFLIFGAYFFITKPLFLFLVTLLFLISVYIHYLNPDLPEYQKKIGYGVQVFLFVYFIFTAGSSLFWLIGATITVCLLHAAFHVPSSTDETTLKFGGGV